MDLESLDRRSFERSIEQEVERIKARPINLSVIANAKSTLESELKYLAQLREVATPEEIRELDSKRRRLGAKLARIAAELAARNNEQEVEAGASDVGSEAQVESRVTELRSKAINYVPLFNEVLANRRQNDQSLETVLQNWLEENKLSRTTVTDYRAGKAKGYVSPRMRRKIEGAIIRSAKKLGLPTPTDAD
jgi:hypothetical protein